MRLTAEQQKQFFAMRKALDGFVAKIVDSPAEINENPAAIRIWKPGVFALNDVRQHRGVPYKCVQAHDSTANPGWTPDAVPALWMQYHGTTIETARPWVAPTGAHDMYKAGEFMIWTDGAVYRCVEDTTFTPWAYPAAWEVM
ncbi:MAG: hypothetical protein IKK34_07160 [Clostridia bacterium]|nr:hypothetical protein [Clostridia bacterium]